MSSPNRASAFAALAAAPWRNSRGSVRMQPRKLGTLPAVIVPRTRSLLRFEQVFEHLRESPLLPAHLLPRGARGALRVPPSDSLRGAQERRSIEKRTKRATQPGATPRRRRGTQRAHRHRHGRVREQLVHRRVARPIPGGPPGLVQGVRLGASLQQRAGARERRRARALGRVVQRREPGLQARRGVQSATRAGGARGRVPSWRVEHINALGCPGGPCLLRRRGGSSAPPRGRRGPRGGSGRPRCTAQGERGRGRVSGGAQQARGGIRGESEQARAHSPWRRGRRRPRAARARRRPCPLAPRGAAATFCCPAARSEQRGDERQEQGTAEGRRPPLHIGGSARAHTPLSGDLAAPASSRRRTQAAWPRSAARCSGAVPRCGRRARKRSVASPHLDRRRVGCRGRLRTERVFASFSAPAASRALTQAAWPRSHATCRGVQLSRSRNVAGARAARSLQSSSSSPLSAAEKTSFSGSPLCRGFSHGERAPGAVTHKASAHANVVPR